MNSGSLSTRMDFGTPYARQTRSSVATTSAPVKRARASATPSNRHRQRLRRVSCGRQTADLTESPLPYVVRRAGRSTVFSKLRNNLALGSFVADLQALLDANAIDAFCVD